MNFLSIKSTIGFISSSIFLHCSLYKNNNVNHPLEVTKISITSLFFPFSYINFSIKIKIIPRFPLSLYRNLILQNRFLKILKSSHTNIVHRSNDLNLNNSLGRPINRLYCRCDVQIAKIQDKCSSDVCPVTLVTRGRYHHSYACDLHDITTDFYYRTYITT